MALLNKKHKDKLIGGLIGIFLVALTLIVKTVFTSNEKTQETNSQQISNTSNQTTIKSFDSSIQNVTSSNIEQKNENSGDVNTDIVSGNKTVNNYYRSSEKQKKATSQTPAIQNNNGFVNIGGNNNTYNQTINPKPAPRNISQDDRKEILQSIPKDYSIELFFCLYEKECKTYGQELAHFLQLEGYNLSVNLVGMLVGVEPKERFTLEIDQNGKIAKIYVQPQKTN